MPDDVVVIARSSGEIVAAYVPARGEGDAPTSIALVPAEGHLVCTVEATEEMKRAGLEEVVRHYRLRIASNGVGRLVRAEQKNSN